MPDGRITSPATVTTPTPPATHPPASGLQPKASGEEAPRKLGVWLMAAAAFALAFAGALALLYLLRAEPAEPRTRPSAPAPDKARTQEPTEAPDVFEDMLHPAAAREPVTPEARFAKRSAWLWRG
jgi:hypothetical protein